MVLSPPPPPDVPPPSLPKNYFCTQRQLLSRFPLQTKSSNKTINFRFPHQMDTQGRTCTETINWFFGNLSKEFLLFIVSNNYFLINMQSVFTKSKATCLLWCFKLEKKKTNYAVWNITSWNKGKLTSLLGIFTRICFCCVYKRFWWWQIGIKLKSWFKII